MKLAREFQRLIERIADEAGATVAYETTGGCHIRVTLTYQGRSRFTTLSSTPRTDMTQLVEVLTRRTLRDLGYVKPKAVIRPKDRAWRNRPPRPTERRATLSGPRYRPRYGSERNAMTVALRTIWKGLPS